MLFQIIRTVLAIAAVVVAAWSSQAARAVAASPRPHAPKDAAQDAVEPADADAVLGDQPAPPTVRPQEKPAVPRQPLPDDAARRKGDAMVDEVLGADIKAAKTSADKLALAKKMIKLAGEDEDATQRFALLNRARLLTVTAGDLGAAMAVADELSRGFEVDAERARRATLTAVAKGAATPPQHAAVAEYAALLLEQAVVADKIDMAADLGSLALDEARKSTNRELIRRLVQRGRELQKIRQAFEETRAARAALAKDPHDADANLAMGKYHCLMRRDWKGGLPLLAQGSDKALKDAAEKDLAAPQDAQPRMQLGDQWWRLAELQEGEAQDAVRLHALQWYQLALPDLSGLSRARVQKRLDEAKTIPGAEPAAVEERPSPAGSGRTVVSKMGILHLLMEHIGPAMKAKTTVKSKEPGFTLARSAFAIVPEDGELLVGANFWIGTSNRVNAMQPIFLTAKGRTVLGPIVGQITTLVVQQKAKPGYAVGAITVAGGLGIDGAGLTFMKIEDKGLNPKQSYHYDWIGNHGRDVDLGGDGSPIVGIFGHHDNRRLSAFGVVTVERADKADKPAATDKPE